MCAAGEAQNIDFTDKVKRQVGKVYGKIYLQCKMYNLQFVLDDFLEMGEGSPLSVESTHELRD